jgi:Domain of unknown function (DUF4824)
VILWSRRRTLIAGIGLILVVNAVALAGVAYNRSGEPDCVLRLTQRELRAPYGWRGSAENSGVALALLWRVPIAQAAGSPSPMIFAGSGGSPAWLDQAKLRSLGFDTSEAKVAAPGSRYFKRQLEKTVLLVLELDGPAYRQSLARARQYAASAQAAYAANAGKKDFERRAKLARDQAEREEHDNTRLFVVDAGLDLGTLRARYPDRARYAIVHGRVLPQFILRHNARQLRGYISGLSIHQINVPMAFRQVFEDPLQNTRTGQRIAAAHFEADVAFGKRLEPWIVAMAARIGTD